MKLAKAQPLKLGISGEIMSVVLCLLSELIACKPDLDQTLWEILQSMGAGVQLLLSLLQLMPPYLSAFSCRPSSIISDVKKQRKMQSPVSEGKISETMLEIKLALEAIRDFRSHTLLGHSNHMTYSFRCRQGGGVVRRLACNVYVALF